MLDEIGNEPLIEKDENVTPRNLSNHSKRMKEISELHSSIEKREIMFALKLTSKACI